MKDLNYWEENAEEDYRETPISVLKYITELETQLTPKDDKGMEEQARAMLLGSDEFDFSELGDWTLAIRFAVKFARSLQSEWVSVNDRLPEKNGIYPIWDNGEDEAHFKDGKWIATQATIPSTSPYLKSKFRAKLNPTHWRLPNPPKQK